jgi:hypothetical protein
MFQQHRGLRARDDGVAFAQRDDCALAGEEEFTAFGAFVARRDERAGDAGEAGDRDRGRERIDAVLDVKRRAQRFVFRRGVDRAFDEIDLESSRFVFGM